MRTRRILWVAVLVGAAVVAAGSLMAGGPSPSSSEGRDKPADDLSRPTACYVTLKSVKVPADEMGRVKEFKVQEGQEVYENALLATLDDRQAQVARKAAYYKAQAAEKDAASDVGVRFARKALDLAELEWEQAVETRKLNPGAVTLFELRRYRFEVEKASLSVEQEEHKLGLAAITADVRRAELESAELDIRRREIRSPCVGRVEKRYCEAGEWVKPGDPVLQVLKTDVAEVQGRMDATRLAPADVEGRPVTVTVEVPRGGRIVQETFNGTVTSAGYTIEPGGKSVVKAEVKNRKNAGHWILRDGMKAEMKIDLSRP
jgi:multidrug resistance efflux pump